MGDYSVYVHTNRINGKQYVGITKQVPENRWGNGGINYRRSCPYFWNAIQKYGWDNFYHVVVASNLSKDEACEIEVLLIAEGNTQDKECGYNILGGGSAPSIPAEIREKMSKAMKGNKNGAGHPCSEEKKKKISDAQKGKKLTPEHIAKLSMAKRGKSHAPPTAETKKKISDAHKKKMVFCEETRVVYPSIHECARQLNLDATAICACCKGRHKIVKGYHFRYYEETTH